MHVQCGAAANFVRRKLRKRHIGLRTIFEQLRRKI